MVLLDPVVTFGPKIPLFVPQDQNGNAKINGNAEIKGNALVDGNSIVQGNSTTNGVVNADGGLLVVNPSDAVPNKSQIELTTASEILKITALSDVNNVGSIVLTNTANIPTAPIITLNGSDNVINITDPTSTVNLITANGLTTHVGIGDAEPEEFFTVTGFSNTTHINTLMTDGQNGSLCVSFPSDKVCAISTATDGTQANTQVLSLGNTSLDGTTYTENMQITSTGDVIMNRNAFVLDNLSVNTNASNGEALYVNGNIVMTGTTGSSAARLTATGGYLWIETGTSGGAIGGLRIANIGNSGGLIPFSIEPTSGNVGINIQADPLFKLDINGTTRMAGSINTNSVAGKQEGPFYPFKVITSGAFNLNDLNSLTPIQTSSTNLSSLTFVDGLDYGSSGVGNVSFGYYTTPADGLYQISITAYITNGWNGVACVYNSTDEVSLTPQMPFMQDPANGSGKFITYSGIVNLPEGRDICGGITIPSLTSGNNANIADYQFSIQLLQSDY